MDLLYVSLGGSVGGSSVQHKIACQTRELNNNGINARAWLFTTSVSEDTPLDNFVILKKLDAYNAEKRWFRSYYETQFYYNQITEVLKSAEFDTIFLRHGTSGRGFFNLLNAFAQKLFLYIPSNTLPENYHERKVAGKTGKVGYAFRWIEYFCFIYLKERMLYKKHLSRLKGVVLFTPEFASMIYEKSGRKANVIYNRDGADCHSVRLRTPIQADAAILKLIFLKGSSMQQPWAGLERLIESIKAYPELKIELYITGRVVEKKAYDYPFVKLTGRLTDDELNNLIDTVDLGVSNLANYMIGFSETTNLKSRDYFARGLPFIQANTMPDVDGTAAEKYYLKLPNNADIINMNDVWNFGQAMRKDKEHANNMRKFAEENLDWKITVKELAAVINP